MRDFSISSGVRKVCWLVLLCFLMILIAGCVAQTQTQTQTRTVYIPDGEPVRLREDIPRAKVWVQGPKGTLEPVEVTLKEGWFASSGPYEP